MSKNIDPPYNTGKEFIYPDNYKESLDTYLAYAGLVDDEGKRFSTNTPNEGRFHTKWLNMMYPRLYLARNLLREDGVIFISIDDNEVAHLRKLCDDIFGEENFVSSLIWDSEGHTDNQYDIKVNHEYVFVYTKNFRALELGYVVDPNTRQDSNLWKGYAENSITKNGPGNPPSEVLLPKGFPVAVDCIYFKPNEPPKEFYRQLKDKGYITRQMTEKFNISYPIRRDKMIAKGGFLLNECRVFSGWANVNKLKAFINNQCMPLHEGEHGDTIKFYLSENGVLYYKRKRNRARNILSVLKNMGTTEQMRSTLERMGLFFQYPKPAKLISYLIKIGVMEDEGIILDFFSGSCTTAHAIFDLNKQDGGNRRFIMIQLPELLDPNDKEQKPGYDFCVAQGKPTNIAEIGKERICRVIKKIEDEQAAKKKEAKGQLPGFEEELPDLDLGFKVFKLDRSNFKIWNGTDVEISEKELVRQLALFIDHIDPEARQEDILYELLLKAGFMPTEKVEKLEMAGKTVFSIAEGALLICLEDEITSELIDMVAEVEPMQFICLDQGFQGNDQLKANAVQTFTARNHGRDKAEQIVFRTV